MSVDKLVPLLPPVNMTITLSLCHINIAATSALTGPYSIDNECVTSL